MQYSNIEYYLNIKYQLFNSINNLFIAYKFIKIICFFDMEKIWMAQKPYDIYTTYHCAVTLKKR